MVTKKKIIIDGKEIEVDAFDTPLIPGSGTEEEAIERLLREEEIEKQTTSLLEKIRRISERHPNKQKNILYYYEVGLALQFVDKNNLTKERGKIWQRLAHDLDPELFGGKKKDVTEAKRHPEFMYLLGKVDKKYIRNASWDQWYEILKFKHIFKDQRLLEQVLFECASNHLSGIQLRNRIKQLRNPEKTR